MVATREAGTYQDELMQLRLMEWKRLRVDETGSPILDKPLLSPFRILDAACLWLYFRSAGRSFGFMYFLRWHRRPYAQFKHPKAGKRYG